MQQSSFIAWNRYRCIYKLLDSSDSCFLLGRIFEKHLQKNIYSLNLLFCIFIKCTPYVKDCGPHSRALKYKPACVCKPTQLKPYFNICAIIFLISTDEESSQPTKHANKILVLIFLTMRATILDIHGKWHLAFTFEWKSIQLQRHPMYFPVF